MLVRVCARRAPRVERGAGPDGGGRSGAPGESRADGAGAGADAAASIRCAAGWRRGARRCRRGGAATGGRRVRDWAGAAAAGGGASAAGAGGGPPRAASRRRSRTLDAQQQAAVTRRGAASALRPAGAAQGRRHDQCLGAARRRAWCGGRFGIGARLAACSGLRRRPMPAATRCASKGSVGRATRTCRRSVFNWRGIGCGGNRSSALTHWYRAHFGTRPTRAADRDRGGGAQTADRAVAVCDGGRGPRGRDPESRRRRVGASHARCAYGSCRVARATATKTVPQLTCPA